MYLEVGNVLWLVAAVFALAYGVFFFKRGPSALKTLVKTAAVGVLAVMSAVDHAPIPLTVGLALCALGDAFLAGDPKRWLPLGLASFLAGHLAYVALFIAALAGRASAPSPGQVALMTAVAAVAVGMLAWLWRSLGTLKAPVAAYVTAIVAMVCSSLLLPPSRALAAYGAVAFFASDGVLSAQLFKQRFTGLAGQWAVWGLYFIGQCLILGAFDPAGF